VRGNGWGGLLLLGVVVSAAGCVKRALLIESNPPGASVQINGHVVKGVTPLTYEFITHGPYAIVLSKSGFREIRAREWVQAPWHQWIPLDFFTELLLPVTFDDQHRFAYALQPETPAERVAFEPPPDVQELMVRLRGAADPAHRCEACVLMMRHRVTAGVEALQAAAHDPNADVRASALQALRVLAGGEAVPGLIAALREDPDPSVRWQAAAELEALRAPEASSALQATLLDRDALVRAAAVDALGAVGDRAAVLAVVGRLRDGDVVVRRSAARVLGRLGDPTVEPALSRTLRDPDPEVRHRAADSLLVLKPPAASSALARALRDANPRVRDTAVRALREFGTPEAVPIAVRYLRSWSAATRASAAQALGGLHNPLVAEELGRAIHREPNLYTQLAMANALVELQAWPPDVIGPYRGRVVAETRRHAAAELRGPGRSSPEQASKFGDPAPRKRKGLRGRIPSGASTGVDSGT